MLLDFLAETTMGLARAVEATPGQDALCDGAFEDTISATQTLLKWAADHGAMDWSALHLERFEALLEAMKVHRHRQPGASDEDKGIILTLYLMAKQNFPFSSMYFPGYLMEVAYGSREHYTPMQDVAAVCCAMISTNRQGNSHKGGPALNVAAAVKDYAQFVHAVSKVPDPCMRVWHFRLLAGWSQRPKVLDEVSADAAALDYVTGMLLDPALGRYSVVLLHNLSALRPSALLRAPAGRLATICEAYRLLAASGREADGASTSCADDAAAPEQRRLLQRLLAAVPRNCLLNAAEPDADLTDRDLAALLGLADCVEAADEALYLATLLHACRKSPGRIGAAVASTAPLLGFLIGCIVQRASDSCKVAARAPGGKAADSGSPYELQGGSPWHRQPADAPRSGEESPTARAAPASPSRGLGRRAGLWQQRNKVRTGGLVPGTASPSHTSTRAADGEPIGVQAEYPYFAAVEILTAAIGCWPAEHEAHQQAEAAARDGLAVAFERHSARAWLRALSERVALHESGRLRASEMFVQVSAKLLRHCWASAALQVHFSAPALRELLVEVVPFFLQWPNEAVQCLACEVALRADLHRYASFCQHLVEHPTAHPELSCALLTRALAEQDTDITVRQAHSHVAALTELIRRRALSASSLHRLAVGLETALLLDHPGGFCAHLVQRAHALFGSLLEAMQAYMEEPVVRQCMVMALMRTAGAFYKPLPELDDLVLCILDLADSLLDTEFLFFMPVLHRLVVKGGRRVTAPLLSRQLHLHMARILEGGIASLETSPRGQTGAGGKSPSRSCPCLSRRQRIQWCLAFFTAVVDSREGAATGEDFGSTSQDDLHLQGFVCTELLPSLLRILRTTSDPYEVHSICFLISSAATSPALPPYMAEILRMAERSILQQHVALAGSGERSELGKVTEIGEWKHLALPTLERLRLGILRSFVDLLGRLGFQPSERPAALGSDACFRFLMSLGPETSPFPDAGSGLHSKLFCLAWLCARTGNHTRLLELGALQALQDARAQTLHLAGQRATSSPGESCDLRLHWMRCVASLAGASSTGAKLLACGAGRGLLLEAMACAEELQRETRRHRGGEGLGQVFACQRALASALARQAPRLDFAPLRPSFTLLLLGQISSAPLLSLRLSGCDHLVEMLSCHLPEVAGATLLRTPCADSLRRAISGPSDELASQCAQVMAAFARKGSYDAHLHLLPNMEAIVDALGDPSSSAVRVEALAELFVALSERRLEVLDALVELRDLSPFLGLARAVSAERREFVQGWLEPFGASLYQIDEILGIFRTSTLRGFLHLATCCTLDAEDAADFRRCMFELVRRRVEASRAYPAGAAGLLSEPLLAALLAMCEIQQDLTAAATALLHEALRGGERQLLESLWAGGHVAWLCRLMACRSGAHQALVAARARGLLPPAAPGRSTWESHVDLVATQGMALRLVQVLCERHPGSLEGSLLAENFFVRSWREHLDLYFQYPWPMQEVQEVRKAMDGTVVLALQIAVYVTSCINTQAQRRLIQQGILAICSGVLLPNVQEQEVMLNEISIGDDQASYETTSVVSGCALADAKMTAGSMLVKFMQLPDAYRFYHDRRASKFSLGMLAQLHRWRSVIFDSMECPDTTSLQEKVSTLFLCLLSTLTIDWCLEHLGLERMKALMAFLLEIWGHHSNWLLRHHALRLFSSFCQLKVLYAMAITKEPGVVTTASATLNAIAGLDARDLRHVLRLLTAALAHTLGIPTAGAAAQAVHRRLSAGALESQSNDGAFFAKADLLASRHLLVSTLLGQVLEQCVRAGDAYSAAWSLWLIIVILVHGSAQEAVGGPTQAAEPEAEALVVLVPEVQVRLRKAVRSGGPQSRPGQPPRCRTTWLSGAAALCTAVARLAGSSIQKEWSEARRLGSTMVAMCFMSLPQSLPRVVEVLDGTYLLRPLGQSDTQASPAALFAAAVAASSSPPRAAMQDSAGEMARNHGRLQDQIIEAFVHCGEGSYDLAAHWLHEVPTTAPCREDAKSLIAFLIGQCACKSKCDAPLPALLDKLAQEVLIEDLRLRRAQVKGEGPLFSSMLCHLLYGLAAWVPSHPRAAANSATVRGAAFSQLMKVQHIIAQSVQPKALYDQSDRKQAKLFLCIRAVAAVQMALQVITGSWFAADFGVRFTVSEQGGRDFVHYCTKHICQEYSRRTTATRVLGTPWERLILSQGHTEVIADLLLTICSVEANLLEASRLGGEKALQALSRYAETPQIRQQATTLLTKLAVIQHV